MTEPTIAAATGYAGTSAGPVAPLIEMAMHNAVAQANALGIADDTPAEKVEELTGVAGKDGSTYIREAKLAARQAAQDNHRALTAAHEAVQAAARHPSE